MKISKKLLSLFLAVTLLLSFMPVVVNAASSTKYGDYLYYQINSDNTAVTITYCNGSATEVDIPDEIDGAMATSLTGSKPTTRKRVVSLQRLIK